MQIYQQRLSILLAKSGALFFRDGLKLKDGRPTPYFINLGILHSGCLAWELACCFAEWMIEQELYKKVDVLLGPSYKGSCIAQAITIALYKNYGINLSFEYDRKESKTHGEASGKSNMFVTGGLINNSRILIVDDVGTSMSTKLHLLNKLKDEQKNRKIKFLVKGVALVIDREQTQPVYDIQGKLIYDKRGPDALAAFTTQTNLPVWALLNIRTILTALIATDTPVLVEGIRQPINETLLNNVYKYLAIYGRRE